MVSIHSENDDEFQDWFRIPMKSIVLGTHIYITG